MARAKALNYEEFIAYAQKHYNKGGDVYVECWDERDFGEYVAMFGQVTKSAALKMFREMYDHERDVAGYGW